MDEDNEYGSGSFVPVDYDIAQKKKKKEQKEKNPLFMSTKERLKNAFGDGNDEKTIDLENSSKQKMLNDNK